MGGPNPVGPVEVELRRTLRVHNTDIDVAEPLQTLHHGLHTEPEAGRGTPRRRGSDDERA
jgi:hypothetical protein